MKNLKRALFAIIAILAMAMPAQAQFRFGLKAGMNVDKMKFDDASFAQNLSTDNRTGWHAGILTEFTVPIVGIGFDASLMYVHHDKELSLDNKSLDYIELPINLKYKLGLPMISHIIIPFATTGPSFAMKCSGDDGVSLQNVKQRKFDVAWNAAVGAELFRFLQLGIGYSWGINKMYEKIDSGSQTVDLGHLNGWNITAAIMF